jgi:hypothetical protein
MNRKLLIKRGKVLIVLVLLWFLATHIVQGFICDQLTTTQVLKLTPKSMLLKFKTCE